MTKVRSKQSEKTNKQGFLQGVITLMFSQVLIKLLGIKSNQIADILT